MGCIKFSGEETCYIQAKVDSIPYGNSPRTIECAFKTTSTKAIAMLWGYGSTAAGTPLLFVALKIDVKADQKAPIKEESVECQ